MKRLINWFKRQIIRRRVKLRRKQLNAIKQKHPLQGNELLAFSVIKKSIFHPSAELLIAPISQNRYIHFDDIYIKLQYEYSVIINGKYSYFIVIPDHYVKELNRLFDVKLESTRRKWELAAERKTNKSLQDILIQLSK
jgi:hypothetical protein